MQRPSSNYFFLSLLLAFGYMPATAQATSETAASKPESKQATQKRAAYAGIGCGLDYGGIGLKIEAVPTPYLGIFCGLGHAGLGLGLNGGISIKPLPNGAIKPVLLGMYGYNDVLSYGKKSMRRDISHGFTLGGGMEWTTGKQGNKLNMGLLAPLPQGEHHSPVTISLGFMLRLG